MKLRSILLPTLISVTGFAQTPPARIPDAGQMLRQNLTPNLPLPQQPTPAKMPSPSAAPTDSGTASGTKFVVSGFEFTGNTILTSEKLSSLVQSYVGREVSLADLNAAARIITDLYRQGGCFLAQAYIPPQNTRQGGKVTIAVIEGVLESVQVATTPERIRIPKRLIDAELSKVTTGQPAIEAPLSDLALRLSDLPAINARVLMEPGDARGAAKAKVQITEGDLCRVWFDADNYGSYATGYYRVGARLAMASPLHLGDSLDLSVKSSTTGNAQIANLSYAVPVGVTGWKWITDYNSVRYTLGESFEPLDADGTAHDLGARVENTLIKNRTMTFSVNAGLGAKQLRDNINVFGLSNERNLSNVQAGANLTVMDTLLGGASSSLSLIGTAGEVDIRNAVARANDAPPIGYGVDGGYRKLFLSASRNQMIHGKLSLFLYAAGQWTNGNLDSSEQFLLGGPFAVRAFSMQEAMCDLGYTTTVELRHPIEHLVHMPGSLNLGLFFDHAGGRMRQTPSSTASSSGSDNTRYLSGAGFSLTWHYANSFSARVSFAWRTSGDSLGDGASDNPSIYFQLMKQL